MGISDIFSDIKDNIDTKIMFNACKRYLERQKIEYKIKYEYEEDDGYFVFEVPLDNRLKSAKLKVSFYSKTVIVNVEIIDSTPREFGSAIEKYLNMMNKKFIGTEGEYVYHPDVHGAIELAIAKSYWKGDKDDFFKECFYIPLKMLESDGDSLYEFIHSLEDGSSSAIVGLGEVPKKGEAEEKGEASSSLGVRMAATMDREGEESRQGQGQAKETLALPPAPPASPNPSGGAGKKKTRGKKDVKGVVTAFKEYMYRNGMFYSDAKKDEVKCIFDLKNKLKTQKFSIIFHAEDHVEVTTRLEDVPLKCGKEEFNKYKDYLRLKFAKCEWVLGMYMTIEVCIYWTIPFDVLSDDSIRHCLSVPVDTLKSIGDDLYDLLNTEPAVDAANESNESKKEDFEWTTPNETMEMVKRCLDEKGYTYNISGGMIPWITMELKQNCRVGSADLIWEFSSAGMTSICRLFSNFSSNREKQEKMAFELNKMNYKKTRYGHYELNQEYKYIQYVSYVGYGKGVKLTYKAVRNVVEDCLTAWKGEVTKEVLDMIRREKEGQK